MPSHAVRLSTPRLLRELAKRRVEGRFPKTLLLRHERSGEAGNFDDIFRLEDRHDFRRLQIPY